MSISNWLESPESFRKMLAALISDQDDKWKNTRRDILMEEPVLRQFAATQWAQARLPDDPDTLAMVTLYVAYQFRWLLVDSVRLVDPIDGYLQDELNITLLLPLYIWPAYQIWVLQEFPAKARLNQSQAIPWLLNRPLRLRAFKELDIPEPNEKFLAYIEVKQNTTNLSRWVKAGLESLHFVMHPVTKNGPPLPITTNTDALQEFDEKPAEILDCNRIAYDAGISRGANLPEPDLARDTGKPDYKYPDSPNPDKPETNRLMRRGKVAQQDGAKRKPAPYTSHERGKHNGFLRLEKRGKQIASSRSGNFPSPQL